VRGGGETDHGDWADRWVHLGTDELYVALNETTLVRKVERNSREETGTNHVGFIVDNVEELTRKYEAAGFKCAPIDEPPARKRLYVTDHDALTWEFVEYLSADPAVRNDYSV
jgi:catechol 2,3-dioxygenase-like lactoylglutathione lyase family enzyme